MMEYSYNSSQSVTSRPDSITSPEMVNVVAEAVLKSNSIPLAETGTRVGENLQIFLLVKAWVKNIAYEKSVWIDVHILDGADQLIHAETLTLRYLGPAGGNGEFFVFDGKIYQEADNLSSGLCSLKPEARRVQFQLYYAVNDQIFTDGILHQHEPQEDSDTGLRSERQFWTDADARSAATARERVRLIPPNETRYEQKKIDDPATGQPSRNCLATLPEPDPAPPVFDMEQLKEYLVWWVQQYWESYLLNQVSKALQIMLERYLLQSEDLQQTSISTSLLDQISRSY